MIFRKVFDPLRFCRLYHRPNAVYPNRLWNYHDDILESSEFNTTTNSSENANRILKSKCGTGLITFHKACEIIVNYKKDYIVRKVDKLSGAQTMNCRKKKTLEREAEILQIVREFDELDHFDRSNPDKIAVFAFRLGSVGKYEIELFEDEPEEEEEDPDTEMDLS